MTDSVADMTTSEFRELFRTVCNWGRWPEHPERGALNFLTPDQVAAAARLVESGITVTLSTPLAGATIRYTLDGSTPTESSPQVDASGEVVLSFTTTLRARAFVSGRVPSVVTSGLYVVTP